MLNNLFSPMKIGKVEIKNRFIVSAMVVNYCAEDGNATERYIAYHEEKAKGGWGLIVTEDYAVDPTGRTFFNEPGFWSDSQIESHSELTRRVHAHGAKIFAQIFHGGRQTNSYITGTQILAPSAIPCPSKKEMPRALTTAEVKELIEKFGDAALRAKKAGFDGVQIHGAHGYLVSEFVSAYSNKRTDEFGGSLINRARFPVEIVKNIRKKCGEDFAIDYKISGSEFVDGGMTIEDTKAVVMMLEKAGIDSVNISAGVHESWYTQVQPPCFGHGWLADYAADVKKIAHIPVTVVGRVNDPFVAEAIIAGGKADAAYMGRASLADPHLPNKAAKREYESIRHCTACLQGCSGMLDLDKAVTCTLNPTLGREKELEVVPTEKRKRIFVAGAGPAGAEAAIVAAQRGHDVTVYEKEAEIGGMYRTASVPPWKGELASFISWQRYTMEQLGVKLLLGTPLTVETIEKEKPDSVILATGSLPTMPPIKGIDNRFVHSAIDVLNGDISFESKKVCVIGGGMIGSEVANFLATHNCRVSIVEMRSAIAAEEPSSVAYFLMKSFREHDVDMYVNASVGAINADGTVSISVDGCEKLLGKFDGVIIATGMKAYNPLEEKIADKVETVVVGDAKKASNALVAIEDGYMAGFKI